MEFETRKAKIVLVTIILVVFLILNIDDFINDYQIQEFVSDIDQIIVAEKAVLKVGVDNEIIISDIELTSIKEDLKGNHAFLKLENKILKYEHRKVAQFEFVDLSNRVHIIEVLSFDKEILHASFVESLFVDLNYPILLKLDGVLFETRENILSYLLKMM